MLEARSPLDGGRRSRNTRHVPERRARLRETLRQLHEQLESDAPLEASLRDELRSTMAESEAALQAAGDEAADRGGTGLGDRLSDLALRFEGSHPRLAEGGESRAHTDDGSGGLAS